MKKFTLTFALMMAITLVIAQSGTMKYQAIVRDTVGKPIKNQVISFTCGIYDAETGGVALWTESQDSQTNEFGLVVLSLGSTTPFDYSMFSENNSTWLRVSFSMSGGSTILNTVTKLEYVPYAFTSSHSLHSSEADVANESQYASDADLLDGYDATDFFTLTNILNQGTDAGGNMITNLADPIELQDAATKNYVDGILTKMSALEKEVDQAKILIKELEEKLNQIQNTK